MKNVSGHLHFGTLKLNIQYSIACIKFSASGFFYFLKLVNFQKHSKMSHTTHFLLAMVYESQMTPNLQQQQIYFAHDM